MIQNIVFRIPSCPLSAVYVSIEEERLLDGVETINVQTCEWKIFSIGPEIDSLRNSNFLLRCKSWRTE